jgi:hypothetical protein
MAGQFHSTQHSHRVVAHQGINQHTRIGKKAGSAQGIRNSSANGASKSAWVCIFPSSPPTSLRSSRDSCCKLCRNDRQIEALANPRTAKRHSSWVVRRASAGGVMQRLR